MSNDWKIRKGWGHVERSHSVCDVRVHIKIWDVFQIWTGMYVATCQRATLSVFRVSPTILFC